jgi:putative MFS transporter
VQTSHNVYMLVFWRLLQGFGLGGNLAVDFSLFMEFVPTTSRGKSSTLLTVFATFGSMTAALLAWLLVDPVRGTGWRPFLLLAAAPGILIAALRARMLESPHYLASSGRLVEAEQVLRAVADYNRHPLPPTLVLRHPQQHKRAALSRVMRRLWHGHLRARMTATSLLWFALSFAFYGFSVWGPSYFEARGFSPQRSYAALFSSVACQIPGTLAASALVERAGRRPLLVIFSLGCCASLSGFAAAAQSEAAMVACSLVLNFNTAALWAVTYTFTPEIFPTALRTSAMGVCSAIARVSGILTSFLGGVMLEGSLLLSLVAYAASYAVVAGVAALLLSHVDMTGVPLSRLEQVGDDGGAGGEHERESGDELVLLS